MENIDLLIKTLKENGNNHDYNGLLPKWYSNMIENYTGFELLKQLKNDFEEYYDNMLQNPDDENLELENAIIATIEALYGKPVDVDDVYSNLDKIYSEIYVGVSYTPEWPIQKANDNHNRYVDKHKHLTINNMTIKENNNEQKYIYGD